MRVLTCRKTSSEMLDGVLLILDTFPNMEEPSLTEPPDKPSRWDSEPDMEDLQINVIDGLSNNQAPSTHLLYKDSETDTLGESGSICTSKPILVSAMLSVMGSGRPAVFPSLEDWNKPNGSSSSLNVFGRE